jgi:hypothetical protein
MCSIYIVQKKDSFQEIGIQDISVFGVPHIGSSGPLNSMGWDKTSARFRPEKDRFGTVTSFFVTIWDNSLAGWHD